MKHFSFFIALLLLACTAFAQQPSIGVKWAPTGLVYGSLSLQGEYNFGRNSLTAKIGVPLARKRSFDFDEQSTEFTVKATSFLAGYRHYLSKKHMKGFYLEPFFKYVHHTSEGVGNATLNGEPVTLNFTNDYNAVGVGAQLGVQFIIKKRIALDLFFLGPEINAARNNFKAVELSNAIPWTYAEAAEAERDIRDFIDGFPFVRNRTSITVDSEGKTVQADFKGALPGIRTGISIGILF